MIAATKETKGFYNAKKYVILGERDQLATLCAGLFSALRDMDEEADLILAEGVEADSYGLAYMNRLLRAAGFHIIDV